ncbi:hypothetical protein U6B65_00180 [Oscillospiraceae bacterium MB08-C2-2]|nr:hypothetical protein U6B65_00180 [Oscillospiraceae bacterium MB08-C2-2]
MSRVSFYKIIFIYMAVLILFAGIQAAQIRMLSVRARSLGVQTSALVEDRAQLVDYYPQEAGGPQFV